MNAGTIAACVMAALALIGLARQWAKDRKTGATERHAREQGLDAIVNQRLKELLDHYDGVFDEYERRARELTGQLGDTRNQNRNLQNRVDELERQVADLQTEISMLRANGG